MKEVTRELESQHRMKTSGKKDLKKSKESKRYYERKDNNTYIFIVVVYQI